MSLRDGTAVAFNILIAGTGVLLNSFDPLDGALLLKTPRFLIRRNVGNKLWKWLKVVSPWF
jgi:hypothetical protein